MSFKDIKSAKEFLAVRNITNIVSSSISGDVDQGKTFPVSGFSDDDVIKIANAQLVVDKMNGESQ